MKKLLILLLSCSSVLAQVTRPVGYDSVTRNVTPTDLDYVGMSANFTVLQRGGVDVVDTGRTLTPGAGISGGGDLSANRAFTLDPTTFVNNVVWFDGSQASRTWTFSLSGATDPVWTIGNNSMNLTSGTLQYAGNTVATVANNLGVFASTTSAQFFGVISDEVGGTGTAIRVAGTASNGFVPVSNGSGTVTWTAQSGSGGGDVSAAANFGTDNSMIVADGTLKGVKSVPAATVDGSGNISTSGNIAAGVGTGVAGTWDMLEGSAPSLVANTFSIYAPTDVAVGGLAYVTPGAASTGFMLATDSSGRMTITHVASSGSGSVVLNDSSTINSPTFTGTLTVPDNSIALGTKTTGNYAAGDAEAGAALTGDSATSFFGTGTMDTARLGSGTANGTSVLFGDQTYKATSAALDALATGEAIVASATTTDIGAAASQSVEITGTTTITGFGTVAAGTVRRGRFSGILTLTYNATSMILPSVTDITTAAGDTFEAVSLGSGNWRIYTYTRADGTALVGGAGGGLGYSLQVGSSATWSPTAGVTAYVGGAFSVVPDGNSRRYAVVVPQAGTLRRFTYAIRCAGLGSGENVTMTVRHNGASVGTAVTVPFSSSPLRGVSAAQNVAIAQGDDLEIQVITPNPWTTPATGIILIFSFYLD